MKVRYFETGSGGYAAVTIACPKDFKDVLWVGKSGLAPGLVEEQLFSKKQISKMQEVRAELVPDDWFDAFNYEKRKPKQPELPAGDCFQEDPPLPRRPRRKAAKRQSDEVVLDVYFPWDPKPRKHELVESHPYQDRFAIVVLIGLAIYFLFFYRL